MHVLETRHGLDEVRLEAMKVAWWWRGGDMIRLCASCLLCFDEIVGAC